MINATRWKKLFTTSLGKEETFLAVGPFTEGNAELNCWMFLKLEPGIDEWKTKSFPWAAASEISSFLSSASEDLAAAAAL